MYIHIYIYLYVYVHIHIYTHMYVYMVVFYVCLFSRVRVSFDVFAVPQRSCLVFLSLYASRSFRVIFCKSFVMHVNFFGHVCCAAAFLSVMYMHIYVYNYR